MPATSLVSRTCCCRTTLTATTWSRAPPTLRAPSSDKRHSSPPCTLWTRPSSVMEAGRRNSGWPREPGTGCGYRTDPLQTFWWIFLYLKRKLHLRKIGKNITASSEWANTSSSLTTLQTRTATLSFPCKYCMIKASLQDLSSSIMECSQEIDGSTLHLVQLA